MKNYTLLLNIWHVVTDYYTLFSLCKMCAKENHNNNIAIYSNDLWIQVWACKKQTKHMSYPGLRGFYLGIPGTNLVIEYLTDSILGSWDSQVWLLRALTHFGRSYA